MKVVSGKEFARLLEKHGWQLKRVSGSHHVYAKPGNPSRISVPIHGNTGYCRAPVLGPAVARAASLFRPSFAIPGAGGTCS
ncbi:MAG: type II toxin-antitoxin system HicA family toxin [Gammaproteobacteria bacterium]